MRRDEITNYLPQLIGKEIKKICYCEPNTVCSRTGNLYFEFADGSHFEIYADSEVRFTGIIQFKPAIGSIVERMFDLAKTGSKIAAKIDETGVWFEYGA